MTFEFLINFGVAPFLEFTAGYGLLYHCLQTGSHYFSFYLLRFSLLKFFVFSHWSSISICEHSYTIKWVSSREYLETLTSDIFSSLVTFSFLWKFFNGRCSDTPTRIGNVQFYCLYFANCSLYVSIDADRFPMGNHAVSAGKVGWAL